MMTSFDVSRVVMIWSWVVISIDDMMAGVGGGVGGGDGSDAVVMEVEGSSGRRVGVRG